MSLLIFRKDAHGALGRTPTGRALPSLPRPPKALWETTSRKPQTSGTAARPGAKRPVRAERPGRLASLRKVCVALAVALAFMPWVAGAALTSATWGTEPKSPVYVGQDYELTLTIVTEKDEEITGVNLDQGPKRAADAQSSEVKGNQRRTVLRWGMAEDAPKLAAIPAGRLIAEVTTVRSFGFMRTASSNQQAVAVPAFSYEAIDLPGPAKGAPVGAFSLRLTADAPTFRTGDVRVLTATLEAREGRVPETFAFALEGEPEGRVYPFRVTARTPRRVEAKAYFVAEAGQNLTLRLAPFQAFDLGPRALREVACPPLTLRWLPEEEAEAAETVTVGATSAAGLPLRFAPSAGAPTVGVLPEAARDRLNAPLERHGDWVRVRGEGGREGWVRAPNEPPKGSPQ